MFAKHLGEASLLYSTFRVNLHPKLYKVLRDIKGHYCRSHFDSFDSVIETSLVGSSAEGHWVTPMC